MSFTWNQRALSSLVGLFVVGAVGCSANVKTAVGPNNSHIITCGSGMAACVAKAGKICDEDGYTIVEGVSRTKLLGGESSAYRERSEIGELTVLCGLPEEEEEQNAVVYKLPERTDEPIVVDEPIAPTVSSVCTPGATLACVGAGACQGGQVCLETGRGYGLCDCGEAGSPSSGPSTVGEEKGESPGTSVAPVVPGSAPTPTPLGQQK